MVTKKSDNPIKEQKNKLVISRDMARAKLEERIQQGISLKQMPLNSEASLNALKMKYDKWHTFNIELLKQIFATSELSNQYCSTVTYFAFNTNPTLSESIADLNKNIETRIHRLDTIVDRLEIIPIDLAVMGENDIANSSDLDKTQKNNKVFVVHGHDEIAKTSLEVFLRENNLEPIVLHRQADEGLTIIEKFEKHSDVGYAIVLLTPDEVAYLSSESLKDDDSRVKENRARPNVIFEFGYFVGKLGRARVCCIATGDVTMPSDISGVVYKRYSNSIEEVAYPILKDLRVAGYQV